MSRTDNSIPDRIRAHLLALGIPATKHIPSELAALFPREFNIAAAGLSTADLARVLVHFAKQGIISASETSIKAVKPGWHFCQFYRDFTQLLDLVAPYIAEGLVNNEGCLWVMPEAVSRKAARDALAALLPDIDAYFASGQLEVLSHPTWYLDDSGRFKGFEDIAGALLGRQDRALARGFKFLRAAGDAGWVSGTEQSKEFIDYEMKVNAALGATQVAAVCTYRADVTADELVAIVTAHQDAVYAPG
jgi:hypothetical protein